MNAASEKAFAAVWAIALFARIILSAIAAVVLFSANAVTQLLNKAIKRAWFKTTKPMIFVS